MSNVKPLTMLVFGVAGSGKSWLSASTPGPRLFIDTESRSHHLPFTNKFVWDGRHDPPSDLPENATVVVQATDYDTINHCLEWLQSGQHPFKGVTLDSMMESQSRILDKVTGGMAAPDLQGWGTVLRYGEAMIRRFRDLTVHPTNPIHALVITCGVKADGHSAMLQGQLRDKIGYLFDVVGYLTLQQDPENGSLYRNLLIAPIGGYPGKCNIPALAEHYGVSVVDPTVTEILSVINATSEESNE